MSGYDTSFTLQGLQTFHLAFAGGYWEGYREDEVAAASDRFEFKEGWDTVYARSVETALARIRLADGTEGWGEANVPIGPEVVSAILENLVLPMARGREFGDPGELWRFLYLAQRGRGYFSGYWLDALAALDIALWDAIGRREGVPVAELLVADSPLDRPRSEIPVYLSGIRRSTIEERVSLANEWVDSGLRGAKIFLTGDLEAGARELEALQLGVPGMGQWMVDVLWSFDRETAPRGKRVFGDMGARFLECPLDPEDLEGHRALVTQPGAPIALGEHFRTSQQVADWVGEPLALDVFQPDIGRTGLTDGLRQMAMATRSGIPTTPHMGNGIAVFQAATLHFSAVCQPTHLQELQAGHYQKTREVTDSAWAYRDGVMKLPDRPGLGVEVREDSLERFAARW
ncbi:MAG: mandelate racemase/muconate lactonizing enzyme family protein [Chloroflexota bacterium]